MNAFSIKILSKMEECIYLNHQRLEIKSCPWSALLAPMRASPWSSYDFSGSVIRLAVHQGSNRIRARLRCLGVSSETRKTYQQITIHHLTGNKTQTLKGKEICYKSSSEAHVINSSLRFILNIKKPFCSFSIIFKLPS